MRACPECGAVADTGKHSRIFKCRECGRVYCYLCRDSDGGRKCPECGSTRYDLVGTVE